MADQLKFFDESAISFDPAEGRTKSDMADACDINKILGKFRTQGFVAHLNSKTPVYGDFSDSVDYQTALDMVMKAQAEFDALPARLRARCENDPGKFVDFASDPANREELVELGLEVPAPAEPAPVVTASPEGGK